MAPIHEAAKHGNPSSVRQLVERQGVDATELDGNGQLDNGQDDSDEEGMEDEGDVPLAPAHYAAMCDAPFVLDYLLHTCGVPVDQPDGLRRTPLYHTAMEGHQRCCSLLLRAGADPCAIGRTKINPLAAAAAREGRIECMKLLLAHFDSPDEHEPEAARAHRLGRRRVMLEQPHRHLGRPPLLQALAAAEWDAAELLLAVGADPTVKDDEGRGAVGTRRAGGGGGEEEESDADTELYDALAALAAKLQAAATEPQRALLLAKARLLVEASAAITRAAAAARDARKPEREVKRLVRAAAPACLRARVEAQEALPSAAVAVVPTKPWVEEEGELLAVIKWVVGVEGDWGNGEAEEEEEEEEEGGEGGECVVMKREHVRELMGYLLPEWAWALAGDGEGTVQG